MLHTVLITARSTLSKLGTLRGRGNNAITETMSTHKNTMIDNYNAIIWTIKSTDSKALREAKRNSQNS